MQLTNNLVRMLNATCTWHRSILYLLFALSRSCHSLAREKLKECLCWGIEMLINGQLMWVGFMSSSKKWAIHKDTCSNTSSPAKTKNLTKIRPAKTQRLEITPLLVSERRANVPFALLVSRVFSSETHAHAHMGPVRPWAGATSPPGLLCRTQCPGLEPWFTTPQKWPLGELT